MPETNPSKPRGLGAWKASLTILLVLGPMVAFGVLTHSAAAMGVALAGGAISAFFLNLDRFDEFGAAGIAAKLRRAAEEAYATTEALRATASPLLTGMIETMASAHPQHQGRIDEGVREAVVGEIERAVQHLSLQDQAGIKVALRRFRLRAAFMRWGGLQNSFHQGGAGQTFDPELYKRILALQEYDPPPTGAAIHRAIAGATLTEDQQKAVRRYVDYVKAHLA